MDKWLKRVFMFYFLVVLIKIIFSFLISSPSLFSDDYIYIKLARSFFFDFNFSVHELSVDIYPPLYPIILSISYLFKDMNFVYLSMKIINAFISSLVIFPSYLLSREFFDKKKSFIISLFVLLIPSTFSISPYVMSENLFYPLFLFTIYFIYKSFFDEGYKYSVLVGIFLALSYLTRSIAVGLLGGFLISYLILFIYRKNNRIMILKKFFVSLFTFFLLISPWMIRNFTLYGFDLKLFFGPNTKSVLRLTSGFNFFNNVIRFFIYIGYLILASFIIFPVKLTNLFNKKNINYLILFIPITIVTLIIAAYHGSKPIFFEWFTGRYIGRYVDFLLPLIFIGGFLGDSNSKKKFNKYLILLFSILLFFSSLLTLHSLFPFNNLSLTWIGVLKYVFEFIFYNKTTFSIELFWGSLAFFSIFFVSLMFFVLFIEKKFSLKKMLPYFFVFLILLNLLNFGINFYDSKNNWYNQDQMQIGLWLNEYDSDKISNILFDETNCGQLDKYNQQSICGGSNNLVSVIGYWLNDNIIVGSVENIEDIDYIISKEDLDYEMIYDKNGIYIYQL